MTKPVPKRASLRRAADAKVIFNLASGNIAESEAQLELVRQTLREMNLRTELTRVRPTTRIPHIAANAAQRGIPWIVACGGDNTIDLAARGLVATKSTLVIIPTGTRNNIARALHIPSDIAEAVRLIKNGKRTRVDMGHVRVLGRETYFLELLTIGLPAALFPALDEAQKGKLTRIGDVLSTFISHPPATLTLNLERRKQTISVQALMMLVLNMPYLGANFQIASSVDYQDGMLDVFLYADLGKLDLLTYALQVTRGFTDDPRVRHMRVKQLTIETDPPMPIMLDGTVLSGSALRRHTLSLRAAPHALKIMTPAQ